MRELLAVERLEEQGGGFVPAPSPAPVGLQLPVPTVKTRSQGMNQPGHTPGQAPRLESLGVGVAPEPRVALPSDKIGRGLRLLQYRPQQEAGNHVD